MILLHFDPYHVCAGLPFAQANFLSPIKSPPAFALCNGQEGAGQFEVLRTFYAILSYRITFLLTTLCPELLFFISLGR